MISDDKWREMLDEFRTLGGTAENVRLGYGAFGRGLFPIEPKKPVKICIPESLLVAVDHVFFESGVFRVSDKSKVSQRGRAFLERYEREFAWGTEARTEIERVLDQMQTLPEELRDLLAEQYLGKRRFLEPLTPELLQKSFIGTRAIICRGQQVVMPIIELANHGGSARYETDPGVALQGTFEGEVLVRYSVPTDPYELFANWLFNSEEALAFSMVMTHNVGGGRVFQVRREHEGQPPPWVPKITVVGKTISANYLLLGHRQYPRVPRGAFHKAMSNAGLEPEDEIFDIIQHANRQAFLHLVGELEGLNSPAVPLLRTMARYQLNALSCYFGIREV